MFFYHNDKLAWISIAKNACTTWEHVFGNLGWKKENLIRPQTDLSKLKFFGFIREPTKRHTMGVVEYLSRADLLPLIDAVPYNKLLASVVFDEHCYPLNHMIPADILNRTIFFAIDRGEYDYEILMRDFLSRHGVEITVPVPRLNSTEHKTQKYRDQINLIKEQNHDLHLKLWKNFLEADQVLYEHHIRLNIKHNQYINSIIHTEPPHLKD